MTESSLERNILLSSRFGDNPVPRKRGIRSSQCNTVHSIVPNVGGPWRFGASSVPAAAPAVVRARPRQDTGRWPRHELIPVSRATVVGGWVEGSDIEVKLGAATDRAGLGAAEAGADLGGGDEKVELGGSGNRG